MENGHKITEKLFGTKLDVNNMIWINELYWENRKLVKKSQQTWPDRPAVDLQQCIGNSMYRKKHRKDRFFHDLTNLEVTDGHDILYIVY